MTPGKECVRVAWGYFKSEKGDEKIFFENLGEGKHALGEILPNLGRRNSRGSMLTPPQIMGHQAIYLDRDFDPPGVACYSDPNTFAGSKQRLERGLAHYLDGHFGPAGLAH